MAGWQEQDFRLKNQWYIHVTIAGCIVRTIRVCVPPAVASCLNWVVPAAQAPPLPQLPCATISCLVPCPGAGCLHRGQGLRSGAVCGG